MAGMVFREGGCARRIALPRLAGMVAAFMDTAGLNLLLPDKPDAERDAVATAFVAGGGEAHRLGRFWDPPAFPAESVRVYGADSFCLVLQQKLGFPLCSPADDLMLRVSSEFLQRKLEALPLSSVLAADFPRFVKPLMPKQFRGAVYVTRAGLETECRGLPPETPALVSEIVAIHCEVRCFVLHGSVLDAACYEGVGDVAAARGFAGRVAHAMALPDAVVIDVGFIPGRGWAVIEFNAAWGAGLNGCDATRVLPAILAASSPS